MKFFESSYFPYKKDELFCENVNINDIIRQVGTPTYIYSQNYFRDHYKLFDDAFKGINHRIFYASKANYNLNVIKTFSDSGAGIDVNSGGELMRALKAGVDPKNIILTGVGKSEEEIKLGLETGVLLIKAESEQELFVINDTAKSLNKKASIAIRINPDVDPVTHPYISTGLAENKFGIESGKAVELFKKAAKLKNLHITGIDMHIGSQITKIDPYVEAVTKLIELQKELKLNGIEIEHIDIGGGMGISYFDEKPFTPKELSDSLFTLFK